jgi:hypothetical protein
MSKLSPPSHTEPSARIPDANNRLASSAEDKLRGAELLTVREAAGFLRCSKSYRDKLRCIGGGPEFVRLGVRKILYRRVDLLNWAKSRRFDSTSQYGQ